MQTPETTKLESIYGWEGRNINSQVKCKVEQCRERGISKKPKGLTKKLGNGGESKHWSSNLKWMWKKGAKEPVLNDIQIVK